MAHTCCTEWPLCRLSSVTWLSRTCFRRLDHAMAGQTMRKSFSESPSPMHWLLPTALSRSQLAHLDLVQPFTVLSDRKTMVWLGSGVSFTASKAHPWPRRWLLPDRHLSLGCFQAFWRNDRRRLSSARCKLSRFSSSPDSPLLTSSVYYSKCKHQTWPFSLPWSHYSVL